MKAGGKRGQGFVLGAAILSGAGLIVKLISAVFKIPLERFIGLSGLAVYGQAYNLYALVTAVAVYGLSVAVSKMVAESIAGGKECEVERIRSFAVFIFLIIGLVAAAVTFGIAGFYEKAVKMTGVALSVRVYAPGVLLVTFISAYRGYFQGHSNMVPTAISQIVEAMSKLVFGMGAAYIMVLMGYRKEYAAAGIAAGLCMGLLINAIYLPRVRRYGNPAAAKDKSPRGREEIFKTIMLIAVPVSLCAVILNLSNLIDGALVSVRLQSMGLSEAAAKEGYGAYSGIAQTFYNFPPAFIVPLGVSLLPVISGAFVRGEMEKTKNAVYTALRIAAIFITPAGFAYMALANPVLSLVYSNRQSVELAAPLLALLGPAVIFVSLATITNAMLQSMGKLHVPVITMGVGAVLKVVITYFLTGDPRFGINGAPIGTDVCYFVIFSLNLMVILRVTGQIKGLFAALLKPVAASVLMCGTAYGIWRVAVGYMGERTAVLPAILIGAGVYFGVMIFIRGICPKDFGFAAKNKKIRQIFDKIFR